MGFVPLHNHSDYSLLDGASQVSKIVDRASELGIEIEIENTKYKLTLTTEKQKLKILN